MLVADAMHACPKKLSATLGSIRGSGGNDTRSHRSALIIDDAEQLVGILVSRRY